MRTINIQLPEHERRCTVDPAELQEWAKTLLDEVLFRLACQWPTPDGAPSPLASIDFRVRVLADGCLAVEW